jgi:hypothetical protein
MSEGRTADRYSECEHEPSRPDSARKPEFRIILNKPREILLSSSPGDCPSSLCELRSPQCTDSQRGLYDQSHERPE